jgi:membrane peptidoglycan carboxypeptidase
MSYRKIILIGLALPAVALAVAGAAAFATFQASTFRVPAETFTRAGIEKILARESVVLYSDGKARVGSFFEGTHRNYLPYDSIPKTLVEALISAEDRNYWKHGGWDVKAFARAMVDNVQGGGRWRGGSTLTQQTAKNLFGRSGPLRGKVDELVNAYRLEQNFSKEEILEFYLNQFFVVGNGHGVSIAARYFFNKEPRELTLVECAFIAGSVKGPNQYNPFIQSTPERRKAAINKGRARTVYVLGQMRRHGKITEAQYKKAVANPPKLNRGDFRFSLSTNMMKVKRLLDEPQMQALLARYGVEDYTAAGLQIVTTLDAGIQRAAEYAVYSNLARLDMVMRGYQPPKDTAPSRLSHFEPGTFVTGRVTEVVSQGGVVTALKLRFGAIDGVVPRAALETFFKSWNRSVTGADVLPAPATINDFAARYFKPGNLVYCGVPFPTPGGRGSKPENHLDIAQRPVLQGAAQVMQEGRVVANVGGFGNTGYDRVNQARRQFGSSFKPIVFAAALELGWHALDPIPNDRQVFQLGNLLYFPKPDHTPEDTVSLAWAGRRSENIASVYLLYHLFDKTDFSGFWEQCRRLGLDPDNFAAPDEFERYVRDTLGVILDAARLRELRYQKAASDIAIDLTFDGRQREAQSLRGLPYGLGFADERQRLRESGQRDAETLVRLRILNRNFIDQVERARLWRRGTGLWVAARHVQDNRLGVFAELPPSQWRAVSLEEARGVRDPALFIEGDLSLETLRALDERLRPAESDGPRYTRENLFASKDFKAQAALRYITDFSRKVDITAPLDEVMSFPLGVNVISLGEAVNAYQVFQEGSRYRTRFGHPQLYIEKIITADGRTIFEDYAEPEAVLTDRTRFMLEAILASVVQGGTGQRIGRELRIPLKTASGPTTQIAVPAYGKTGTTNDYRNAAFLGFMAAPKGQGKGYDPTAGYAIGVYTGYDDNRPLTNRLGFRGTGASAAIPAWLDIARNIARLQKYSERVATAGDQFPGEPPLFQQDRYKLYKVTRRAGLPATREDDPNYIEDLSDELSPTENIQITRDHAPLWIRED